MWPCAYTINCPSTSLAYKSNINEMLIKKHIRIEIFLFLRRLFLNDFFFHSNLQTWVGVIHIALILQKWCNPKIRFFWANHSTFYASTNHLVPENILKIQPPDRGCICKMAADPSTVWKVFCISWKTKYFELCHFWSKDVILITFMFDCL